MNKKPLSKALKTFYGVGDFGFSLMAAVEMYAFMYFLTNVAMFPVALATTIAVVTSAIDAALSPIYGAIINGVKAMKWGRYRSWLVVAPIPVIIFYALTFTKIGPDNIAAAIIIVGFVVSHVIWNIAWVANVALINLLSTTPEETGLLSSRRQTYTSMSNLFTSYTSLPLAIWLGVVTNNPILGFTLVAGGMAMLMGIGYYVHFVLTKGYEPEGEELKAIEAQSAQNKDKVGLKVLLSNLFQNKHLMFLLLADFFKFLPMFIVFATIAYQYTYVIQNVAMMPVHILIGSVGSILGSYFASFFFKRFSTKNAVLVSLLIAAVSFAGARVFAYEMIPFMALMALGMFTSGIYGAGFVAMYADTVVYGEWKTGKNTAAFNMGLMNFPLKMAIIARSSLLGAILLKIGFDAAVPAEAVSSAVREGIANIITVVPAISFALSFLIILFGYRLTNSTLFDLRKDIEERKQQAA
ncbi:MFS transporter [Alkalibacter rhizosphaerae]|uniref:MFS transporter n=1 Tax=Alkalibacter rhizosphaerae TaxID=2815577 RepID=A0A974XGJ9_9FIRM|nr:MFS transporter [Alkalibacter rhizosphaerae]QSX08240.1 MFS transporter [Alkalibacter rhizosphaerae]